MGCNWFDEQLQTKWTLSPIYNTHVYIYMSSLKVWKLAQTGSVPVQRLFEGSIGPTPAQHLLWTPKSRTSSISHIPLPYTHLRPPLPTPRPVLPHCGCHCSPSRCSPRSCWSSMLGRGPVAREMASRKTYGAIYRTTMQRCAVAPFNAIDHSWRRLNW